MIPDPTVLAFGIPAMLLAGISKGGFGSGASFAGVSLFALVLEPQQALGIMMPLLLLIDFVALAGFRRGWHPPSTAALILGGVPGVLLGALFSGHASPDGLRLLIGGIALAFVAWQVGGQAGLIRVPPLPFRWDRGLATGVVAGFTSFVSHAGGPAVAVFLLGQGLDKTTYQATTVVSFTAVNVMKAVFYGILGFYSAQTLMLDLWLAPAAALGTWIGIKAHYRVPEGAFFTITYVLLTVTGTKLIWDALT